MFKIKIVAEFRSGTGEVLVLSLLFVKSLLSLPTNF